MHQLTHQVLDIASDVTGFAKFRGVRLYKRNFDQIGDVLNQICLSDSGRADQNDVLFRVLGFFGAGGIFLFQFAEIFRVVVMIAHRDRKNFLGFVLFDDKAVEMSLDVTRQEVKNKFLRVLFCRLFVSTHLGWLRRRNSRKRDAIAKIRLHELGDFRLKLLWGGKRRRRVLFHRWRPIGRTRIYHRIDQCKSDSPIGNSFTRGRRARPARLSDPADRKQLRPGLKAGLPVMRD